MAKRVAFILEVKGAKRTANELARVELELKQISEELKKAKKEGNKKVYAGLRAEQVQLQEQGKKLRLELRQQAKEFNNVKKNVPKDSLIGLRQEYIKLRRQIDLLSQADRNSEFGKKLIADAKKIKDQIDQLGEDVGDFRSQVGSYKKAIGGFGKNLLASFGVTSASAVLFKAVKDGTSIIKDFDEKQTNLASILGKTREETIKLNEEAKAYGATTAFSATQVTELQTALAKLGFTQEQISQQTKSIIDFSVATNAGIGESAELIGGQLRAFNLSASETDRVASVLAISTTKSALSFEKLKNSLSQVSPVAQAFGFSIEDTVALVGTLVNSNFEASKAGTAVRNILLNIADSSGALAKELGRPINRLDDLIPALKELNDKGIDLNETLQLTDKRSVAAFNRLLSGAEDVAVLRDSITGVNAELEEMAERQLQSVSGRLKLLNSAWEGFILSIDDGTGSLSESFKSLIDDVSLFFSILTKFNEGYIDKIDLAEVLFDFSGLGFLSELFGKESKLNKIKEELEREARNAGVHKGRGRGGEDNLDNSIRNTESMLSSIYKKQKNLNKESEEYKVLQEDILFYQKRLNELKGEQKNKEEEINKLLQKNKSSKKSGKKSGKKDLFSAIVDRDIQRAFDEFNERELKEFQDTLISLDIEENLNIDDAIIKLRELAGIIKEEPVRLVRGKPLDAPLRDLSVGGDLDDETILRAFRRVAEKKLLLSKKSKLEQLQFERDKLRGQLDLDFVDRAEHLRKIAELEVQIDAEKNNQIKKQREELYGFFESLLTNIGGSLLKIERQRIDREFQLAKDNIDAKYMAEIEAVRGNDDKLKAIEKERERRRLKAEREFQKKKKAFALKEAIIQGALAIIKNLGNPFAVASTAILTALQIATIKAQEFYHGGFTGRGGRGLDGRGGFLAMLHPNEYVAPAQQVEQNPELFRYLDRTRFERGGFTNFVPNLFSGGEKKVTFSESDIANLGKVLYKAILQGSQQGVAIGVLEGNKEFIRELNLNKNAEF